KYRRRRFPSSPVLEYETPSPTFLGRWLQSSHRGRWLATRIHPHLRLLPRPVPRVQRRAGYNAFPPPSWPYYLKRHFGCNRSIFGLAVHQSCVGADKQRYRRLTIPTCPRSRLWFLLEAPGTPSEPYGNRLCSSSTTDPGRDKGTNPWFAPQSGSHRPPTRCHLDESRRTVRPLMKCRGVEVGSVRPRKRVSLQVQMHPPELVRIP